MKFKLLVAIVPDEITDTIVRAARDAGATGATVITSVRGEGLSPARTFLGLSLAGQRDIVLLIVEEHLSRSILETIAETGRFETMPGTGAAIMLDIEDVIGLSTQIPSILTEIEEKI